MNQYYIPLKRQILSDKTKKTLTDYILANPHLPKSFYKNTESGELGKNIELGAHTKPTGLQYIPIIDIEHLLPDLRKLFTIPITYMLSYVAPNNHVLPHRDSKKDIRQAAIVIPLYPTIMEDYSPTLFYDEECKAEDCPALINLQELHAVRNNNNIRFNFQIYFGNPWTYHEVKNKFHKGELFNLDVDLNEEIT